MIEFSDVGFTIQILQKNLLAMPQEATGMQKMVTVNH